MNLKKILVIEDDFLLRKNIEDILSLGGFKPIVAENGKEGVELAKENKPDLILSDIMMPKMDGYGVLIELKKESITASIPLIFLTAKADRDDRSKGMNLGADDYLIKPFTPKQLLAAINARLEKKAIALRETEIKLNELRNNIALALPHEFRTPLNGIIPSCELLKQCSNSLKPEEIEEIADIILDSARRLQRMTENYLLYGELELTANNPQKLEQFRKKNAYCYTKAPLQYVAQRKAVQFRREEDLYLELEDGSCLIHEIYFCKIIEELVDNAFKFSQAGTPVKITSKVQEKELNIFVVNEGRGMTSNQIEQVGVYMQFNRAIYEQQGVGFGLILAKKIIELHGGKLRIKSILNQQTTFQVILPVM